MKRASGSVRVARKRLHPIVRTAGEDGQLPTWARVDDRRRGHVERVAGLMAKWASEQGRSPEDCVRWRAAGLLHDALKDVDSDDLRGWAELDWPEPLLHGPAVAARLRSEGVRDEPLLRALAFHSVGHPSFDNLGKFLYLADYLDPGRQFRKEARDRLRDRLPVDGEAVLRDVAAMRLVHLIETRRPLLSESIDFWNHLAGC